MDKELGFIRLQRAKKVCQSVGVISKINPHSYIFLVCQGGRKI